MKYCCTRGSEKNLSFEDALFKGYSSTGGLYMPEEIPELSEEIMQSMVTMTYSEMVKKILRLYVDVEEIPTFILDDLVDKAHSSFSSPNIIEIANLKNGLNIAELFHGETLAFKDLALSVVGQLLKYFLSKKKKNVIILVGTSGDTGSSAIHSVKGLDYIDIIVLYPKDYCTKIQELQMITVLDKNVHCFAVKGNSDELDVPIKQCSVDEEFVKKHHIFSVNSINWARIAIQIVHYFYIYFKSCTFPDYLEIIVPTGAAGNLAAGYIAHKMGLPIFLISCTNSNKTVSSFLKHGKFQPAYQVFKTLAPAMDIQVAYNLERLIYLSANFATTKDFAAKLDINTTLQISKKDLQNLQAVIKDAESFSDEEIKEAIFRCWKENSYYICPHTATAVAYHYKNLNLRSFGHRICIATASADKFPEAITASNVIPRYSSKIANLHNMPIKYEHMTRGENWLEILKTKIENISKKDQN